jgi:hypothetical protein
MASDILYYVFVYMWSISLGCQYYVQRPKLRPFKNGVLAWILNTAVRAWLWYGPLFIWGLLGKTTKTLTKATCVPARILDTMHVDMMLSLLYPEVELVFFLQTLVISYQAKGKLVSYGLFKRT